MFSSFLVSLGFTQNLADFFQCGCFGLLKPYAVDWTSQYTMIFHPAKEKILRSVWMNSRSKLSLWCVCVYVHTLWCKSEDLEFTEAIWWKQKLPIKALYFFRFSKSNLGWHLKKNKLLYFLQMQVTFGGDNIHLIMDKMCYFQILYWLFQNRLL